METMDKDGAIFSDDRKYRFALFRMWDLKAPNVMFIGLNPSTANEHDNDPTIRPRYKIRNGLGLWRRNYVQSFPAGIRRPRGFARSPRPGRGK